jgi:hypothetical protein
MKVKLSRDVLPSDALLLTCSSHETRCRGLFFEMGDWKPAHAILFHYDDDNPKREVNHKLMEQDLRSRGIEPVSLEFTESSAVKSLHDNMRALKNALLRNPEVPIVFDISVFTKRHLLMLLRWLDDEACWSKLWIIYSEPDDYDVSKYVPLSFGLSSLQQIPGFAACPDLSRPLHLAMFLGYEGDRALAVYEHLQPMQTTLAIPHPPYRPSWAGRTQRFNADLIGLVGPETIENVDAIDPENVYAGLIRIFGAPGERATCARVLCPLGTKPQAVGIYSYVRNCVDPPAIVYASPMRHNHELFSHGVGDTWILKGTS